ncbi:hypothetical protein [Desulfosediminicola ganghwensis]|uniref:hypothetical protein n=1 Tax=Desulfosediminicola ganghwensis TaxID=2569540 RepID=UPI0010AD02B7|nr:hypothetical protein [Desulfosediminicola ganghwensis]
MDAEKIKLELDYFIDNPLPEVLILKGKWGSGKTRLWQDYFLTSKNIINEEYKTYSYSSCFGCNSLNELKKQISENRTQIKNKPPIHYTLKEIFEVIFSKQKDKKSKLKSLFSKLYSHLPQEGKISFIAGSLFGLISFLFNFIFTKLAEIFSISDGILLNLGTIYNRISFALIKKSIVCIDDLERKGKGLEIDDIMGLVAFLKEQRLCKVIIILNENAFSDLGPELKQIIKYKEKVSDSEIEFTPSIDELIEIAKPIGKNEPHSIIEYCTKLDIRNIRIILKINKFIDRLHSIHPEYEMESDTRAYLYNKIVFYFFHHYSKEPDNTAISSTIKIEDIPDLLNGNFYTQLASSSDERFSEDKEIVDSKVQILLEYGGLEVDSFDEILTTYLKSGEFNTEKLALTIKEISNRLTRYREQGSLDDIRNLWLRNLSDDTTQLRDLIFQRAYSGIQYWSGNDLRSMIFYLDDIIQDEDGTKEIIDLFIEKQGLIEEVFDLSDPDPIYTSPPTNEYFLQKCNEFQEMKKRNLLEEEILDDVFQNSRIDPEQKQVLENSESAVFLEYMEKIDDRKLHSKMQRTIQLISTSRPLLEKMEEALSTIGSGSNYQKMKVVKHLETIQSHLKRIKETEGTNREQK